MKKMIATILLPLTLVGCGISRETATLQSTPNPTIVSEITLKEFPEEEPEVVESVETITYRVTAYCACEKCCGKWATQRPLDENGEPIVFGALGTVLTPLYSCASPMPFGTMVELDGFGMVEVEDRTAKWVVEKYGENIIDIYMTDHDECKRFGVKYLEGRVVDW